MTAEFTDLFTEQVKDEQGRGVTSMLIKKREHSPRGLSFSCPPAGGTEANPPCAQAQVLI